MTRSVIILLLVFMGANASAQAEQGLVAWWDFNEGKGDVLHDKSGNKNDGKIRGAKWVKCGKGYALKFDGVDDYVDCGNQSSLDLGRAATVMAWVFPESRPEGEPAIVMKQGIELYGLTFYRDGRCWWYISGGGNNCSADLDAAAWHQAAWHQVVGTYDGKVSRLYIDGDPRASKELNVPIKRGEGNLVIGKRPLQNQFFNGMIDEVRIYDRALSAEGIRRAFEAEEEDRGMRVRRPHLKAGPALRGEEFLLRLGPKGGMQVEVGRDLYFVESCYSYPGKEIGHNYLSEAEMASDPEWKAQVRAVGSQAIQVTASGRFYSLKRRLQLQGLRISVADTLTNISKENVGIIIENMLAPAGRCTGCLLCGEARAVHDSAKNPTVFLSQQSSHLGALAEDDILRCQFWATAHSNKASFGLKHLGLPPGESVTLEWALYPLGPAADYFTFINRVRDDWDVNFTLIGPGMALPGAGSLLGSRDRLAALLKRNQLKLVKLSPWLDYDNLHLRTGQPTTRNEYKRIMARAKATIKSVDPSVKIIGMIEAPFVDLPLPLARELYAARPGNLPTGYHEFTSAETQLLRQQPEAWARWKDSVVLTPDGRMKHEAYKVGKWPMVALTVSPVLGNGQHAFLMDQARFIIEECGLDGFYVDSFVGDKHPHYGYTHDRWDGVTVDINPATGKITSKYTDLALAGAESRKALVEYGLKKGGVVLINGHAIARRTQALHALRYNEGEYPINVYATPEGQKPPLQGLLCEAQLSTPISLGVRPYLPYHRYGKERARRDYAKIVVLTAIHYLRHGVLYYHYGTEIPQSGPGSGEYGPFNHMFPITPVRLFEGGIEGRERTVTCVSGTYVWKNERRPRLLLFDPVGREKEHNFKCRKTAAGWSVEITLRDWQEIAVIE